MIRLAVPEDATFVSAVGVATGMFPPDDTSVTDAMMSAYFASKRDEGHACFVDELEGSAGGAPERVAVAYIEPLRATEGAWELLMIAVAPTHQRGGRGQALLRHLESYLAARGQRLLLVQTSGDDSYAPARAFYARNGYRQEARVRDYYADHADMVLFRRDVRAGRKASGVVPSSAGT